MGPFLVMLGLGLALFALGGWEEARARRRRLRSTSSGRPAGPLIRVRPDTPQRGTEIHALTDWERP